MVAGWPIDFDWLVAAEAAAEEPAAVKKRAGWQVPQIGRPVLEVVGKDWQVVLRLVRHRHWCRCQNRVQVQNWVQVPAQTRVPVQN